MSLDRFIFCPCTHALDMHGNQGCGMCRCVLVAREVIDGLLETEREAIHRTWLGCGPTDAGAERALRMTAKS